MQVRIQDSKVRKIIKCESPIRCGNYATHYNKKQRKSLCNKCECILRSTIDDMIFIS